MIIKLIRWCIDIIIAIMLFPCICAIGVIANILGVCIVILGKLIPDVEFIAVLIYDFAERLSEMCFNLVSTVIPHKE